MLTFRGWSNQLLSQLKISKHENGFSAWRHHLSNLIISFIKLYEVFLVVGGRRRNVRRRVNHEEGDFVNEMLGGEGPEDDEDGGSSFLYFYVFVDGCFNFATLYVACSFIQSRKYFFYLFNSLCIEQLCNHLILHCFRSNAWYVISSYHLI